MHPDERISDAIRAVARAEASRDFSAKVRARIEAGDGVGAAWWPRIATACAAVLVAAAVTWWPRETRVLPTAQVAQTAPAVRTQPVSPQLEPRFQSQDVSGTTPVVSVAQQVARARIARSMTSDHDRALEPLSPLGAISLPSIAPDALVVVDHVVAPLAPIAPLPVVHELLGDAERGEL